MATKAAARKAEAAEQREKRLTNAVIDVLRNHTSENKAAKDWSVGRSKLQTLVKEAKESGAVVVPRKRSRSESSGEEDDAYELSPPLKKRIMGRPTVLTEDEENELERDILALASRNSPLSRSETLDLANDILRSRKGGTDLREVVRLGPTWLRGFMQRHSGLSLRVAQPLSVAREEGCSKRTLMLHLTCLLSVLEAFCFWRWPGRIWNVDETAIQYGDGKRLKVLAERGARQVHCRAPVSTQHVSTLFAVNAEGRRSPVTFVLPTGKTPLEFWCAIRDVRQDEWMTVCEKKGFVNRDTFRTWLRRFADWLDNNVRIDNPDEHHLLILDQCSAHASLEIYKLAQMRNIVLYYLPPHTTHVTQPVDVGLFGPLKAAFRKHEKATLTQLERQFDAKCRNWNGSPETKPGRLRLTLCDIPRILQPAIEESFTRKNVESAFRATGIVPYNRDVLLAKATTEPTDRTQAVPDATAAEEAPPAGTTVVLRPAGKGSKMPLCGMMTLTEYLAAEQEKETQKRAKEQAANQKKQERTRKADEKRAAEAAKRGRKKREKVGERAPLIVKIKFPAKKDPPRQQRGSLCVVM